jgi:hypothetical protein
MRDMPCFHCNQETASWAMHEQTKSGEVKDNFSALCSRCFLYESNWAQTRRAEVDRLALDLEIEVDEEFERDEQGRLTKKEDADRLLGGIAVASRFVYAMGGRRG